MIWHASWHAVLHEHMASSFSCFLLGISNRNVSSHSIEDTHPKPLSAAEGWVHMPFPIDWDGEMNSSCGFRPATTGTGSLLPPEEEGRIGSSPWSCGVRVYKLRLSICSCEISSQKKKIYQGRYQSFRELSPSLPSQYVLIDRRVDKDLPVHFTAGKPGTF